MHQLTIISFLLEHFPIGTISLAGTIFHQFYIISLAEIIFHRLYIKSLAETIFSSVLYHFTSRNHFPSTLYHFTNRNHFPLALYHFTTWNHFPCFPKKILNRSFHKKIRAELLKIIEEERKQKKEKIKSFYKILICEISVRVFYHKIHD